MTLCDIKERLRELIDLHSEDERGDIINPAGLVDCLYRLELEIERHLLINGVA